MYEITYRCSGCNHQTALKISGGRRRKTCRLCFAAVVVQSITQIPQSIVRPKYADTLVGRYSTYRSSAKKRGLPFSMTEKAFFTVLKSECHYCGISPTVSKMGVDRKDNSLGYVAGNCLPACRHCNYAKGQLSYDAFTKEMAARRSYFNSLGPSSSSGGTIAA